MKKKSDELPQLIYSLTFEKHNGRDPENDNPITSLPSLSKRRVCATKILNSVLRETPEQTNTVYALSTYATPKWAKAARESIGIDQAESERIFDETMQATELLADILKKTGIRQKLKNERIKRIDDSDLILGCVEEAVNWLEETPVVGQPMARVIKAIHFMEKDSECVSNFLVNEYYKSAIHYIYDGFGEQIDSLVSLMSSYNWISDGADGNRYSAAYHNTFLLLQIYPILMHRFKAHKKSDCISDATIQKDANGLHLLSILESAVKSIKLYPSDGEGCCRILSLIMKGKSDEEIRTILGVRSSSLFAKKSRAVNLLSFVLWGYSTTQIMSGIVFAPLKKKDLNLIL